MSAVVTSSERATLQAKGSRVGAAVHSPADTAAVIAERDAAIAASVADNDTFAAAAAAESVSDVKVIRADYYESYGVAYLSVEAKWAQGQTSSAQLVVERDSGPGTALGSGGSQNISRFVDAGVYPYHRGAARADQRPDSIRVVSPDRRQHRRQGHRLAAHRRREDAWSGAYERDFITSYLTPTELYQRIQALAAEFPHISEIVELPHQTNGYRRHAQAVLGATNANRIGIDSRAWGHEGGNDIVVELVAPPGRTHRSPSP